MSDGSSIEWTDATWNPVRGCSRVSAGCRNCYAERVAARFRGDGDPFHGFAYSDKAGPHWTGKVELILSKLDAPLRWNKPRRIFVNSMSDLFHERLSDDAIAAVFGIMEACQQHAFQVLTKRPERMRRWFEWIAARGEPSTDLVRIVRGVGAENGWSFRQFVRLRDSAWPLPNVWLGVSVENQATADERIPLLLKTPAAVRFVSYEPALGAVDFVRFLWRPIHGLSPADFERNEGIDWLIVGGESGPGARPCDVAWIRSAVAQCKVAGVPAFVKQLGAVPIVYRSEADRIVAAGGRIEWDDSGEEISARLVLRSRKGGDPSEWPEDLRVREFPR